MVRNFRGDGLNLRGMRNIRNTDRESYNCGGYALNTFSWYCPYSSTKQGRILFRNFYSKRMKLLMGLNVNLVARLCAKMMIKEFNGDLRIIKDLSELQKNEYAIAFRVGQDGDFHFVKRTDKGLWLHKVGGDRKIRIMKKKEVLGNEPWANPFNDEYDTVEYNSKTILLAKKK